MDDNTYTGRISGIGNEITADDLAEIRNFFLGWDYGVLDVDGTITTPDSTTVVSAPTNNMYSTWISYEAVNSRYK